MTDLNQTELMMEDNGDAVVATVLHAFAFYRLACFWDCGQQAWQRHKLMSLKLLYFSSNSSAVT